MVKKKKLSSSIDTAGKSAASLCLLWSCVLLNPCPPAFTHTQRAWQEGCNRFILWPLKEWQLTVRHCQFLRGSGTGTHWDWQRGPQPDMPGNGTSPSWQGTIHLAPSPHGRKSAMLSPPRSQDTAVTAPLPPGPTCGWQAFGDIIFINAMLTRMATFTSLGKNSLASLITHFNGG